MTAAEILGRIGTLRALVVGDICVDRWSTYDPALSEPSRETGLTRTAVVSTVVTAGAGGTVANNLKALGVSDVAVLGAVGGTRQGRRHLGCLRDQGGLGATAGPPCEALRRLSASRTPWLEEGGP